MKSSSWSLAAALVGPAVAVPHNPWQNIAHKPGFMPKYYSAPQWQGWGSGWGTGATTATSSISLNTNTSTISPSTTSWSSSASTTAAPSITVVPSYTTYTVIDTETLTITACPASVTDCPEAEKTTWTSCSTHAPSVVTDTIYVTATLVDTTTAETSIIVTAESDTTVIVYETDIVTTSCSTTGWAAMTTYTFDSDKTTATAFPVVTDTTRAVPTMPSSISNTYSVSSSWSSTASPTSVTATESPESSAWIPVSSASSSGPLPTIVPGFEPACTRAPIPGCTPCEGLPGNDPATWCGLDINTDYYETWPITCMKVTCKLTIDNATIAPDGFPRLSMVINGKLPGDLIEAWWGDIIEVEHTNNLQDNGTSLHFHGLRQLNTNEMDGVASITQCPVPGGASITQTFVATQYGHTWYHSHYSLQAWEGVYAPLVIHGPSTWSYDYDLGPVMLGDWLHTPVFELFEFVERTGSPTQDNVLINGVGVFGTDNETLTGERAQLWLEPGKKHRLQLVCTALDSSFAFSIDNHIITVMGIDFVPIHPYTTEVLKIGIGQRYDIVIEANQAVSDYWMRVDPLDFSVAPGEAPPCGSPNVMADNTMAIVRYIGSSNSTPSTSPYPHTPICEDEPYDLLVPWLPKQVGTVDETVSKDLVITQNASTSIYRWYLSGSTFQSQYSNPTLFDIYNNNTNYNDTGMGPLAVNVNTPGETVYIVIETPVGLSHPIHLHGHDFYVLSAGNGSYTNQTLNLANPPRRDVATLPIAGYLVIAFVADNPGSWLLHCHIGWHVSMGFALQIIETPDLARQQITDDSLTENCAAWVEWDAVTKVQEIDSGV